MYYYVKYIYIFKYNYKLINVEPCFVCAPDAWNSNATRYLWP